LGIVSARRAKRGNSADLRKVRWEAAMLTEHNKRYTMTTPVRPNERYVRWFVNGSFSR